MSKRRLLLATAPAMLLAGCGFALRHVPDMPFRRIALQGFAGNSLLAEELRRLLSAKVQVVATPAEAEVVLNALADQRTKTVVASTAAAQVREYQLRVRLLFEVTTPGGRELLPATDLAQARDMTYSETFAQGKEQEEAQLYRAMQSDIAGQVMRRLARLPPA